jgi:hypothetical protein
MHGMQDKYAKLKAALPPTQNGGSATNPYIDPSGYETELNLEEGAFRQILAAQRKESPGP